MASQVNELTLRNKVTGELKKFSIFKDELLSEIKQSESVSRFDMTRLEVEYDYDTETEQIKQSITMLRDDLKDAIDFFVKQDPLMLIENIAQ